MGCSLQGLVPDFIVTAEGLVDGASNTSALAELKLVRAGSTTGNPIGGTTYPTRGVNSVFAARQGAVTRRGGRVQGDRERDARKVDEKFCGTAPGADGPVLRKLRTFGQIVPLVVGHFGEWGPGLYSLSSAVAKDAAPRVRALFGARSAADARSRGAWYFRREVAWAGLNANARLKLERAEFVGWDARSANATRAERARYEHARRADCAWARAAYERPSERRDFPRDRDGG
jgi:hypothetical protein